jgi:hypothetical protein
MYIRALGKQLYGADWIRLVYACRTSLLSGETYGLNRWAEESYDVSAKGLAPAKEHRPFCMYGLSCPICATTPRQPVRRSCRLGTDCRRAIDGRVDIAREGVRRSRIHVVRGVSVLFRADQRDGRKLSEFGYEFTDGGV